MKGFQIGSQRARFNRCVILCVLCTSVAGLLGSGTPCTFAGTKAPNGHGRAPTFAERVAYQYAIEEVYWHHRIWPKDNPQPKPPLDAFVSQQQIENKISDYLQKCDWLRRLEKPITPADLQAEMNRMARHTHQSDILRELFAALGNDPFLIAECLARPILADRLVSELAVQHYVEAFVSSVSACSPNATVLGTSTSASYAYKLPKVPVDCIDDAWSATSTLNAPSARAFCTVVWTGSEMIVWGGADFIGPRLNTGGRYNPATDSWTATSLNNAPSPRNNHTGVWTGNEMIVWGGEPIVNTGGRYNPVSDTWTAISMVNVPPAAGRPTSVWTGTEMIVWGGYTNTGILNTGGRYNPSTDSWRATTTINAPERRFYHTAEWTGREMIVWGGSNQTVELNTGGRYSPATDSWIATNATSAPLGRAIHTAIWSGSEMIVWGGVDLTFNDCNTGGRYNPTTDSWAATSTLNAPSPRDAHTAVWTGSEMIIWGGVCCNPGIDYNTGGRYNPGTDDWTATGTANVPDARASHAAVWTGDKMIVWGGYNFETAMYFNTGGSYCAQPSAPLLQSAVSRKTHDFSGIYDIPLPLSGTPAIECRSGGATNDYSLVVTFLANVSMNGNPQAAVSSGIGTVGSAGISNGGRVIIANNVVTIPLTNVANAQAINVTLYGVNGLTNFVIPMSILIGDTGGNGRVNAADIAQTKSQIGQQINGTNFRSDVNANGYIDAVDVSLVKSSLGTGVP